MSPARSSIAVLPFRNLTRDPDNEYFSDGLTEELINLLSNMSDLRVAARSSSFRFREKALDVREIGRETGRRDWHVHCNRARQGRPRSGFCERIGVKMIHSDWE